MSEACNPSNPRQQGGLVSVLHDSQGSREAMEIDLHNAVRSLPVRNAPHWEILEYCRHIGIAKTHEDRGFWVARIRTKAGKYKQQRLMPWEADADTQAHAIQMAREWFSSPQVAVMASDPYPKGSKQELGYCPWGEVFTVGHALRDPRPGIGTGYPRETRRYPPN